MASLAAVHAVWVEVRQAAARSVWLDGCILVAGAALVRRGAEAGVAGRVANDAVSI